MMKKKMNILLITTDQQRYDTLHAAGNQHMITPNLDRLAGEGCLFSNAYSPNPACIPARHNILTGLGARYHGFDDNYFDNEKVIPYDLPTFPQLLSDHGYDTAGIGKMHFQPCRRHNGFQHLSLMEEIPRSVHDDEYAGYLLEQGYGCYQSLHGVRHLLYMMPQQSFVPESHHGTTWVTDQTIEYIKKNAGKRPFALWTSYIAPHPPLDVPERFASLYQDVTLPEPVKSNTPISPLAMENETIAEHPGDAWLRRMRELYMGAVTHVDEQIGRIITALEASGELDQTLILFTSDHGEMLGDCNTYQKFLPYDGSARIPMIIRCPEFIRPGSIRDDFVDLNDILPTCLEAAGLSYPLPGLLKGKSLLDPHGVRAEDQYVEYGKGNRRWVSVRDRTYKYNYYYGGGLEELFQMQTDPKETTNLLYGPECEAYEKIRQNMRRRLVSLEEERGLPGYVEKGDFRILEPYTPRVCKERNFPMHLNSLSEQDRKKVIPLLDEMKLAIKREKGVDTELLDTEILKDYE